MADTIMVVMDLPPAHRFHRATLDALEHAGAGGAGRPVVVVTTDGIDPFRDLVGVAGVVIGPGSPYRDPDAAEAVIRTARVRGVPLVGT